MGAVNFSIDPRLLAALTQCVEFELFVETGTYLGDTAAIARGFFPRVVSIECSDELAADAGSRFAADDGIEVVAGHSADVIRARAASWRERTVFFWLDAHWCSAEGAAEVGSQCPLLDELEAIGSIGPGSVVAVDDARYFLAPPPSPNDPEQWPAIDHVIDALRRLSACHRVMVVNDVIVFYPESASGAMAGYAANALELVRAVRALEAREQSAARMREMDDRLLAFQRSLEEKEAVIREQESALGALRGMLVVARPVLPLLRLVRRTGALFHPRLGVLDQHPPEDIVLPRVALSRTGTRVWPSISIATPSFRQASFIERTVRSVVDQDYPDVEYFVQDGQSDDGTMDILAPYENRLSGLESRPDRGQSHAINLAMEQTRGEVMGWLNSDDLYLPGALARVGAFFAENPGIDVVYGNRLILDEKDRLVGRWILPGHCDRVLSWADFVPQETMFWRRRIWERVGASIDESFRFAMDWDLLVRFRDAGARMARLPCYLGAFRLHDAQKTSKLIDSEGFAEMDRIRRRIHGRDVTRDEIRRGCAPYLGRHVLHHLGRRALEYGGL